MRVVQGKRAADGQVRPNAVAPPLACVSDYVPRERDIIRITAPGWGPREEKSVPKRTEGTSRSTGRGPESALQPPLPDLTGVTLRTLRTCDDPTVTAAVESALRAPEELSRVWRSSGTQGGNRRSRQAGAARTDTARAEAEWGVIRSTSGPAHRTAPPPGSPASPLPSSSPPLLSSPSSPSSRSSLSPPSSALSSSRPYPPSPPGPPGTGDSTGRHEPL
jgi:hypothetical protein